MKTGHKNTPVGPFEYVETTPEELQHRYNLKPEDVAFICNKEKQLQPNTVGWNKYASLLQTRAANERFNEMHPSAPQKFITTEENAQIAEYEKLLHTKAEDTAAKNKQYTDTIGQKKTEYVPGVPLTKETLYYAFLEAFKMETGKKFIQTEENVRNLECIIKYFVRDESFFDCEHLVKDMDGKPLEPSFGKGLLLVGSYGNGKSSMMKCISLILNHNTRIAMDQKWDNTRDWMDRRFAMAYCHNLCTVYDGLGKNHEKVQFFQKYRNYRYCFDDLTKEDVGSNFGRKDIMRVVMENRYDNKSLTHSTLNFPDESPGNIKAALLRLGNRYGGHIYDRAYQMYNIIDFRGKSFRK